MADVDVQPSETTPHPASLTWRKLLGWSALWTVAGVVLINVFAGIIPPLLVMALLWVAGAIWLRRSVKGPAILLLVVFVIFLAMSAPYIIPTLSVPASTGDFVLNIAVVLGAVVGIVAAVAVLRRRTGDEAPRKLALVGGAVLVVAVAVSVVALVTYDDAAAQEGDIELAAADFEFSDESLEADSGEVAVYVENEDSTLHTFTIDDLDVDLAVPAGKSARTTFQAEPGTYTFYCIPHEFEMEGELEVR